MVVETAELILEMGSNILKVRATDEGVEEAMDLPFKYYFIWFRSHSNWRDGFSQDEKDEEYKETYDYTEKLLSKYDDTGKIFFIGHWEGDWYLLPNYDKEYVPTQESLNGMIAYYNTRQQAIEDALQNVEHRNVDVFQYAEVNRVRDAMDGKKRLVNEVLPHVDVDYVSYSAYDVQGESESIIHETLDYIESNLKPKAGISGKRVFVGEFAFPAINYSFDSIQHEKANREVIIKFLRWGCPFILYWEMYNNEILDDGTQRGFWLIDDKNVKQELYYTLQGLYSNGKTYIGDYLADNGAAPSLEEFRAWALAELGGDIPAVKLLNKAGQKYANGYKQSNGNEAWDNGDEVMIYDERPWTSQTWKLVPSGEYFKIVNLESQTYLSVTTDQPANDFDLVILWGAQDADSQLWEKTDVGGAEFKLKNVAAQKYLTAWEGYDGNQTFDNTDRVVIQGTTNNNNQIWSTVF